MLPRPPSWILGVGAGKDGEGKGGGETTGEEREGKGNGRRTGWDHPNKKAGYMPVLHEKTSSCVVYGLMNINELVPRSMLMLVYTNSTANGNLFTL